MKRRSIFAALFALLLPALASAQVPVATPTPNPLVYDDAAMHVQVPSGWQPVAQRHLSLKDLTEDPLPVAGWVNPDHGAPKSLVIQLQAYDGSLAGFDGVYEQQLRTQFGSAFIKSKEPMTLANGMPALFFEMTAGEGFSTIKAYGCIWIDGTRGVAMLMSAHLGDIEAQQAKALFQSASATQYPLGRD